MVDSAPGAREATMKGRSVAVGFFDGQSSAILRQIITCQQYETAFKEYSESVRRKDGRARRFGSPDKPAFFDQHKSGLLEKRRVHMMGLKSGVENGDPATILLARKFLGGRIRGLNKKIAELNKNISGVFPDDNEFNRLSGEVAKATREGGNDVNLIFHRLALERTERFCAQQNLAQLLKDVISAAAVLRSL